VPADRRPTRLLILAVLALFAGCGETSAPGSPEDPGPEVLERITRAANGGAVHLVRLIQRGDQYAFDPSELAVRRGDVVRFVMGGSQPESVVFDPVAASPEAGEFIRTNSLHMGVLLTQPGQAYDVSFQDAPPGRYPFLSLPHQPHEMTGVVQVGE
jgi:plastocyanin